MRRGKQFNSMTYGKSDPLTRGARRTDILLDPRDLDSLGLAPGAPVALESEHGSLVAHVKTGPCRTRHVQAFWPEANVLLGRKYDPGSGEPDYATSVEIRPITEPGVPS
jgi:formylmethanofuran dehydrogenase subunit D